jgi:GT2 family glycosyltransferase
MLDLSVVIVTFNSERFIISCLDSLFNQGLPPREIFVVDNDSKDVTLSLLKDKYPQVNCLANKQNLGPCKARNQGIEASSGQWVLVLDSDVVLDTSFFRRSQQILPNVSEDTGVIQPKILGLDRKAVYSAGISLSFFRRFYDIGQGQPDNGRFSASAYIFGACSACAIYRRKMLQELKEENGYFDERFFFLAEDLDLSWRAQRRGWKTMFSPQMISFHRGGGSLTDEKLRQYLCFRNRYYTIMKNEGFARYALKILPLVCYDIPRICYLAFTNPYLYSGARESAKLR